MLTQGNQQLIIVGTCFQKQSNVSNETFENKSIAKWPSNTKQMNRVQNIRIEIWKYKAVRKYKV